MPLYGLELDRRNPRFCADDFLCWLPQYKDFLQTDEGTRIFSKLRKMATQRVFKSVFNTDWEIAMSYFIAHYLTLIGKQERKSQGKTLAELAGGGVHEGVVTSAGIGGFNKSMDFSHSMLDSDEALFWNQTSYDSQLMSLFKTKSVPMIFVVTDANIKR